MDPPLQLSDDIANSVDFGPRSLSTSLEPPPQQPQQPPPQQTWIQSEEEDQLSDQLSDIAEEDQGWSKDNPDPDLNNDNFFHMYQMPFQQATDSTRTRFELLKTTILKALHTHHLW